MSFATFIVFATFLSIGSASQDPQEIKEGVQLINKSIISSEASTVVLFPISRAEMRTTWKNLTTKLIKV